MNTFDVETLENKIRNYAKSYYAGTPEITDEVFDNLVDTLREIAPDSEVLKSVGWGSGVEGDGKKADHMYTKIVGLPKVKNIEDIPDFGTQIVISAKLDGLSAVCYYNKGLLIKAITRGNGITGIDITDKMVKILDGFTELSNKSFTGSIRGELVISNENWKIMKENDTTLKNSRNTVAGIINRNEITSDIDFVDFVVYNIVGLESNDTFNYSQVDVYEFLRANFFGKVCPHVLDYCEFGSKINYDINYLKKLYDDFCIMYPCDGLVIGSNNLIIKTNSKSVTYEQIAFKFPAEIKESRVIGITYNLTRTNKLVPVINIEKVQLSGADVSNVTGFNCKFIKDNKICTDAVIGVMRSGEVIPDFQYLVSSPDNDELPKVCPVCGGELEWKGVDLVCNNPDCGNKEYRDLQCWINNLGKVDNIGDTLKFKFMNELGYTCINDLYTKKIDIVSWARGTHKTLFKKVMDKLLKDSVNVVDALCALNIPRLGRSSAEKLASNKGLIECLMSYAIDAVHTDTSELEHDIVKLVGSATAESIMNNLNKVSNLKYVRDRLEYISTDELPTVPVAITGKLSMKRADFEKILNKYGYKLGGVNRLTRFLITDNPNSSSSKNKLADELGIEKITEEEFTEKYLK